MPNRREGEFVKAFTQMVFNDLSKAYLGVSDCLVNVDNHMDAIMEMIYARTSETRIIGIHGMGGIGKTTISKMIYNQLSRDFENCCFLRGIRETSKDKGIECLQNQLISEILKMKWIDIKNIDVGTQTIKERLSTKKVLLLLDDVAHKEHMDALIGKCNWFGTGSKLIITTRNKDVLKVPEVDGLYEVKIMDSDQSLQLFSKHAFRRDSPLDEYINQSNRAIGICGGLPLALEVIGSLLSRTEKEKWDGKLKELENVPPKDVQSKLKISYNALRVREKHIFLDIACLFIGYDKDIVVHFRDKSKKFPDEAMEVLQNMSLISIEKDNKVWMHDQLRDLGREIVRQESNMKIEKQSRVWDPKEGLDLLRRHKGKKKVEALRLKLDHQRQYRFTYKGFESLSDLRFLEVYGSMENFCAEERLLLHESPSNALPTNENSDLLPQLRWFSWRDIPPTFDITNFSMEDVVILDLSESKITHDWKGWSHMEEMKILKVLNLTNCHCLERTPNFSTLVNLERLILQGCSKLVEIDGSICQLKHLGSLDVRDCRNLRIFTASKCLSFMLPPTIGDLTSLEYLSLKNCKQLKWLPDSIGNLKSLIELDISKTSIRELPDSIGNLENLKVVKMTCDSTSKIPNSFWTIEKLEEIEVTHPQVTHPRPTKGFHVKIGDCIHKYQSLRILKMHDARIYVVPQLSKSLVDLQLGRLYMKMFPDLSDLTNLKRLCLEFAPRDDDGLVEEESINIKEIKTEEEEEESMPWWIGKLSKLEILALTSDYVTTLPTDITLLPRLQFLTISCRNLRDLPSLPSSLLSLALESEYVTTLPIDLSLLPRLQELDFKCPKLPHLPSLPSSLSSLILFHCYSLCSMEDLSNLKRLSDLQIIHGAISEIRGLDCLQNLQELELRALQQVEILPDLSNFNKLRSLQVGDCDSLLEIQGQLPQSLEELEIFSCESLQQLPDLSSLKGLQKLDIIACGNLVEIQLELPQSLKKLQIDSFGYLQKFPNLSSMKELRKVVISGCDRLVEIQGELPQSLEELGIYLCESLEKLPNLSSLKGLQKVTISDCGKLDVEAISRLCSEKSVKFVGEDEGEDNECEYEDDE
ncbi:disease resistance protein RPV1-like [Syzygium oleosum]|uniref:disease resistance protein RPV1-like n=1 Tax=Syzygium oleosum TaxID=219896 RepID=UPI0024BB05ED|nr:disease resistance protein RPV1-like [Syzygium oleosum]